jgi:type IV secretion system protein TrbL
MKKHIFLPVVLLVVVSSPAFSVSIINAISNHEFTLMDLPLANGMDYFFSALPYFASITMAMASILGFTTIVWNAFRLWGGTQDVKKAVIDIVCKIVLFTALLNIYPSIVDFVLVRSSSWGAHAGSGMATVFVKFSEYRDNMQVIYDKGRQQLEMIASGEISVSPDVARALAASFYADEEKVEQFLAQMPAATTANTGKTSFADSLGFFNWQSAATGTNTNVSRAIAAYNDPDSLEAKTKLRQGINSFYRKMERLRGDQFASEKELGNAIAVINAMDEIFSENPAFTQAASSGAPTDMAKYVLDPYMKDAQGNPVGILSPAAVIKMGVIISSIIQARMNTYYDENSKVMTDKTFFIEHPSFTGLLHIILGFLMIIGIIAAVCFYVIQYVMCIFEYAIVTSVGAIFIAFCLFDGTKSFTAKLITLFTSYFIKIMVMNFCLFWVLGTFVDVGSSIMMANEPGSLLNFGYFFYTLMLCWVVTQNGPQIAVTVLNGTPQLSMGEFLHAAGTAAAGAAITRRAVGSGAALAGGTLAATGKTAQAGIRNAQTGWAMYSGAASAAEAAGLAGGTRDKATRGAFGAMLLASAKQSLGEMATGTKGKLAEGEDNTIARVGAGQNRNNQNADGTQGFKDAQLAAKTFAGNRINQQKADAEKNAPPPPKEPPKHPSAGPENRRLNERPNASPFPNPGGGTAGPKGGRGGGTSRENPPRGNRPPPTPPKK